MTKKTGRPIGSKDSYPQHRWSKEEVEYLTEITQGHSYKEILELMNNKFEYEFRMKQIQGAIKRYKLKTGRTGHFKKGFTPWNKGLKGFMGPNKTSFKSGICPINHREVGSERITRDGYIEIKIAEPNKWDLKHRVIYEKHHGPIENGDAIIFLDGNKLNTDINNLKAVSRHQLLVLNKNKLIKNNPELTNAGINIANILIKANEVKNRK